MNIFEFMYDTFKFDQDEIKLIELFSGVGSQAMALHKLSIKHNFNLNIIGVSEIDKYAIKSYNEIHGETNNFGNICEIKELPYTDILTYSFPCQDISLAGNRKGFSKGSGTRSGLLWEVERILEQQQKIGKLPKVLLMENVKALASVKFVDDFNKWQLKLQELGYSNYWEILNAKHYGIPQNRERVFMVSILGEYNYSFPKPIKLKLRLKDLLEDEVDDKYYLSEKQLNGLKIKNNLKTKICIPEATKKGYSEALNGDGVYINRPHQKRGVVQKGMMPTLKTGQDVGVVVKGIFLDQLSRNKAYIENEEISTTLKAQSGHNGVLNGLRIRKLTPLESWRLMGFSDYDFNLVKQVNSNSQLYKQAGNSIVVDVLYYIFEELL